MKKQTEPLQMKQDAIRARHVILAITTEDMKKMNSLDQTQRRDILQAIVTKTHENWGKTPLELYLSDSVVELGFGAKEEARVCLMKYENPVERKMEALTLDSCNLTVKVFALNLAYRVPDSETPFSRTFGNTEKFQPLGSKLAFAGQYRAKNSEKAELSKNDPPVPSKKEKESKIVKDVADEVESPENAQLQEIEKLKAKIILLQEEVEEKQQKIDLLKSELSKSTVKVPRKETKKRKHEVIGQPMSVVDCILNIKRVKMNNAVEDGKKVVKLGIKLRK